MSDFVYDILPTPNYLQDMAISLPDFTAVLIELTISMGYRQDNLHVSPTNLADLIYNDDLEYRDVYKDAVYIFNKSRQTGLFNLLGNKLTKLLKHCERYHQFSVNCSPRDEYFVIRLPRRDR